MFITGDNGCIKLRRASENPGDTSVRPEDVNIFSNRFGFDGSGENLITGDRVEIATQDPRGLAFIDPSWWADGQRHRSLAAYANVNSGGSLRLFRTFAEAINNDIPDAGRLSDFSGAPINVTVDVRDVEFNPLGGVTGYTFNTDRAAIDTTSLGELFTTNFSAGNITGSGTIDCYFQPKRESCGPDDMSEVEINVLLPKIILRTELGGQFSAILQLFDDGGRSPVFYEIDAIATRTGVTVRTGGLIELAIDFVTTGEYKLRIGEPSGYILREDFYRITKEQDIDFLLTEPTD